MKNKKPQLLPSTAKILTGFGENIKLARLRRKLSAEQVAERANISRPTLHSIETVSYTHLFIPSIQNVFGNNNCFFCFDDDFPTLCKDVLSETESRNNSICSG